MLTGKNIRSQTKHLFGQVSHCPSLVSYFMLLNAQCNEVEDLVFLVLCSMTERGCLGIGHEYMEGPSFAKVIR